MTDDFTSEDFIPMSKHRLRALGVKPTKTAYEIRGFFVKSSKDDALFLEEQAI